MLYPETIMLRYISRIIAGNKNDPLSKKELKRLRRYPRYSPMEATVFGTKIFINDSCTLLGDVRGILQKCVYQFKAQNDNPVIIDCGANIGMSVLYFKRLYPRSQILAFEPDPNLFNFLQKNVTNFAFDDVSIEQKAIWLDDHGVSFLSEGGHSGAIIPSGQQGNKIVEVHSVRLKDVLEAFERVDMLKMDIEGAENEVLFDCGNVLSRCDHVFVEYHSRNDSKQRLHSILELFHGMGYRYHIQESFTRKHPFVDRNCLVGMDLQLNLFFSKQS